MFIREMRSIVLDGWRESAVRVVEELFPVTAQNEWDRLLDLRKTLRSESCGTKLIREFLKCRLELELDHFLPFYRLRRIISAHLKLEGLDEGELMRLLRGGKVRAKSEWEIWEGEGEKVARRSGGR